MSPKLPADTRIAEARTRLSANLGALQQRLTRARVLTSPGTYLRSPWLKVGLGLVAGYLVGRPSRKQRPTPVAASASAGLVHAAARAAVTSLAGMVIQRLMADLLAATPQVAAAAPEPAAPTDRDDRD
ncbi:MAG: hypothetical protein WKG01_05800 [Kofleriaceae bacterium]